MKSKKEICLDEDIEEIGFTDVEAAGDCVSSFSFDDDNSIFNSKENIADEKFYDNRRNVGVNGITPPINGEHLNVSRTYLLRNSTVHKINKLKAMNPDAGVYVSTIVDLAIDHYYDYTVNNQYKNRIDL